MAQVLQQQALQSGQQPVGTPKLLTQLCKQLANTHRVAIRENMLVWQQMVIADSALQSAQHLLDASRRT